MVQPIGGRPTAPRKRSGVENGAAPWPASGGKPLPPPALRASSATAASIRHLGATPKVTSLGEPRRPELIGSRKRPLQEETQLVPYTEETPGDCKQD